MKPPKQLKVTAGPPVSLGTAQLWLGKLHGPVYVVVSTLRATNGKNPMWRPKFFADKPGGAGLHLIPSLHITDLLEGDSPTEWDPF